MVGPDSMSTVAKDRRVPFFTRIAYGIGESAEGMKRNATSLFVLFYYNQVLGLPGTLAGTALFIGLLVDAFTDPLIGTCPTTAGRWDGAIPSCSRPHCRSG